MGFRSAFFVCFLMLTLSASGQGTPAAPNRQAPQQHLGIADTGPPPAPPPLPHPATETQLREFLQLTDAPNRVHHELADGLANMRARVPQYFPPVIFTEIDTQFGALDIAHVYLPWFQAYLSEQDMNALLAFYRTDAGKHYASVQGEVLSGAQRALSSSAQTIVQSALAKHKDEIDAAKKAYESQQTPAPK